VNRRLIERIEREADVPNLLDVLAERLPATDLQSLLLEVYRRRASGISGSRLLEQYERNRFFRPSPFDPAAQADFDRLAWSLLPEGYAAVELSPVCPLGTNSAIAAVDQNKVITTIRNSEVVADSANVLALECASRRRRMRAAGTRSLQVKLAASHRLLRAQSYTMVGARSHFRLLALCAAGRDEGSFQFETRSLVEQITYYLRLLSEWGRTGTAGIRVGLTDLGEGVREAALEEDVLAPVSSRFPQANMHLDRERVEGRGYYWGARFKIYASDDSGSDLELVDGGFTDWTQRLLSDAKERLLISGLGTERLQSEGAG
jgi:hypothetical protein